MCTVVRDLNQYKHLGCYQTTCQSVGLSNYVFINYSGIYDLERLNCWLVLVLANVNMVLDDEFLHS